MQTKGQLDQSAWRAGGWWGRYDATIVRALTLDLNPVRWILGNTVGFLTPLAYRLALSGLRLGEVPIPSLPAESWVRLRTTLGGICGTDLKLIMLRNHPATFLRSLTSFPMVPGHENVAVIEAVGKEVQGWQVGQRVCVEPALSCVTRGVEPVCRYCAHGQMTLCECMAAGRLPPGMMIGVNKVTGGSWGPYFVAHHSQLHAVPDSIDDDSAVLVDPLACALHAVLRFRPSDGERVLVVGSGILAVGVVRSLRAVGVRSRIGAVIRRPDLEVTMRQSGADDVWVFPRNMPRACQIDRMADSTGGSRVAGMYGNHMLLGGFDVVYDCVGTSRSFSDCLKFARGRGTVVLVGTTDIGVVDTTPLWFSELTVVGANGRQVESYDGARVHTYELCLRLMRDGLLKVEDLRPMVVPLSQYRRAFQALLVRGPDRPLKIAFQHESKG